MVYHIFMRRFGRFIFLILVSLCLCGCSWFFSYEPEVQEAPDNRPYAENVIDCPEEIANRAFEFAELYRQADTVYEWGGQDALRAIKLDCSGLVIRCYQYALEGTKYSLLKDDMASSYMCDYASTHVLLEDLRHGDLLFMGDKGNGKTVNHIAIFDCIEKGRIYFIDCTKTVNKVSRRSYPINDTHFKYFGMMRVKTK